MAPMMNHAGHDFGVCLRSLRQCTFTMCVTMWVTVFTHIRAPSAQWAPVGEDTYDVMTRWTFTPHLAGERPLSRTHMGHDLMLTSMDMHIAHQLMRHHRHELNLRRPAMASLVLTPSKRHTWRAIPIQFGHFAFRVEGTQCQRMTSRALSLKTNGRGSLPW